MRSTATAAWRPLASTMASGTAWNLQCRQTVRSEIARAFPAWGSRLGPDHLLDIASFGAIADTALTSEAEIEMLASGLPSTFVPGRNLVFFTYAAALGYRRGLHTLVGGMCETDYSGYPDCRDATLRALGEAIRLGTEIPFVIETPLMWLSKAETWELAERLGGQALIDLMIEHTHTCYRGERGKRHDWGYGCGTCPACELRARGYEQWRARGLSQISAITVSSAHGSSPDLVGSLDFRHPPHIPGNQPRGKVFRHSNAAFRGRAMQQRPQDGLTPKLQVTLRVNGVERRVSLRPWTTLLDALREYLDLTGTKKGCDHGQCGACTVLVDGRRIVSCLTLAVMKDGAEITTIEGLAADGELHPLQKAFISHDGFQCGYCTPGQICSAVGLIAEGHAKTADEIRELMSGNVCRCGCYPNIVAAIEEVMHGAPSESRP